MIYQAHELAAESELQADICIVGAGAAGITIALELIRNAPNLQILLLEGGTQPIYNYTPPPREISPSQFLYRGILEGDMSTIRPAFLTQSRSRSYGGSTNCWGGWCHPLHEIDFAGHGAYAGWPISRDDLLPFYIKAQQICFLDQFVYDDPDYWIERGKRQNISLATIPSAAGDPLRSVVFQGIDDSRWSFFDNYRDELASAPNLKVVVNANLLRIETTPDGSNDRVTRLHCASLDENQQPAQQFSVSATRHVLALGGIEIIRALLLSPSQNQPNGLGNNDDLLGRFFNVHPVVTDAALVRFGSSPWPTAVNTFYSQETLFTSEDEIALAFAPRLLTRPVQPYEAHSSSGRLGHLGMAQPQAGPNYTRVWATLTPTDTILHNENIGNFRIILRGDQSSTKVDVNWEQTTEPNNRIVLADQTDIFGLPLVKLQWQLHERDLQTYNRALELTEAQLQSAGYLAEGGSFTRLFDINNRATWQENLPNPGDHHMGGTRMSLSPDQGVVRPDGRLHAVSNLYISSCSVFPSSGWANPTLTIIAMATRLANHLIQEQSGVVPAA